VWEEGGGAEVFFVLLLECFDDNILTYLQTTSYHRILLFAREREVSLFLLVEQKINSCIIGALVVSTLSRYLDDETG